MLTYRVQDPTTDTLIESFDFASDEEIAAAIDDAHTAFASWAALSIADRGKILGTVARLFDERKDELASIAATEMGKPINEAVEEAEFASAIISYYATNGERLAADLQIPTESSGIAIIRRRPIGPLLGIMPWNFPYYQIARFVGPNLMLGNTILLKDAEICPRSALAVQAIMDDAGVPHGVYNNVFASHEQASTIIADPRIQGVSLTGSESAGAAVAEQAGRNLKKCVLELGGSDPYIILDTDDVAAAAKTAWETRMYNTGQACNSNKRMIVMDDIYEEFVAQLKQLAEAMRPGTPQEASAPEVYSSLSSRAAAEKLHEQLQTAVQEGATLVAGGELADKGAYISPAVLTDVKEGTQAYSEELFGPVAVVYRVTSDDEALALANDTPFGLGGAVFSTDTARAENVATRLEVGMANVNTPAGEGAEMPFGGVKRSGYGRELGPLGMDEFVNKQLYYVER